MPKKGLLFYICNRHRRNRSSSLTLKIIAPDCYLEQQEALVELLKETSLKDILKIDLLIRR
jgi:hypothetical protein